MNERHACIRQFPLCHVPISHENNTIMNVLEALVLGSFKLCTLRSFTTQTQYRDCYGLEPPDHRRKAKDNPLSSPKLSLITKGTPSLIHLYPQYLRDILEVSSLNRFRLKLPYLYTQIISPYDPFVSFGSITIFQLDMSNSNLID